jgi:hypothetical protein
MPERSFRKFQLRLNNTGLRATISGRALAHRVSLRDLYEGGNRTQSISAARRAVYRWLVKEGWSVNEVARLFNRAPSGVLKMTREKGQ